MASCTSLNSILKGCDINNVGGIYTVYINDQQEISGTTVDITGHTVTAITLTGSNKYQTFQFNRNIGNLKIDSTVDLLAGSTVFKATLTLKFLRREATKSRALQVLGEGQRYLSIIVKDAIGNYTYIDYAQLSGGDEDTGTKKEDGSHYNVIFTADLDNRPYFVASGAVATVITIP